jgi:hypothetical protein
VGDSALADELLKILIFTNIFQQMYV